MIIKHDPFFHIVIDNFFPEEVAHQLSNEFVDYQDPYWKKFDNPIENKKISNNWNIFPKTTYSEITRLLSNDYIEELKKITGIDKLYPDIGLSGAGWHMHGRGGKLNVHRDYVIHPKINLSRKLNLIIYLTPNWNQEWGGGLELWSHDSTTDRPKELVHKIECVFNRAIIFDTTQNSWHGLPNALTCPDNVYRKSIALYYLTDLTGNEEQRYRAQFVPSKEQMNDKSIEEFCEQRSKLY